MVNHSLYSFRSDLELGQKMQVQLHELGGAAVLNVERSRMTLCGPRYCVLSNTLFPCRLSGAPFHSSLFRTVVASILSPSQGYSIRDQNKSVPLTRGYSLLKSTKKRTEIYIEARVHGNYSTLHTACTPFCTTIFMHRSEDCRPALSLATKKKAELDLAAERRE
ncbi:hypothetical protein EDD85DRAFT_860897 [Armillaria nabsnona]|nr:hypothetical protein EDD85DRAFT_860897 [Armillaria nabsnona]